jgi:hypothetical protein
MQATRQYENMPFRQTGPFGWDGIASKIGCLVAFSCVATWAAAGWAQAEPATSAKLDADPHLAGWWKFDETAGSQAEDSSPHRRAGVLEGGLSFEKNSTEGERAGALQFEERDQVVRIADYRGVGGTAARSVSVWVKTERPQGEIVAWGKREFGQMWILGFIRGRVGVTPNGGYLYMAEDVDDNDWHHVAAVVHEAETPNLHDDVTLYLNGEIAEIDGIGLLDLWPIETGQEQDVTIGRRFQGALDDLRIYERALTDEEVAELHKAGN